MVRSMLTWLALAAGVAATAAPAAAQHCWPASVTLVLRDENGAVLDPREVEVTHRPEASDAVDFSVEVEVLSGEAAERIGAQGAPALTWWGRGKCRIDIDTVVVRRGGREMRLLPDVRLNTLQSPGPSRFLVDTPPFSAATFVLTPLPPGTISGQSLVPASAWRAVGGEAGAATGCLDDRATAMRAKRLPAPMPASVAVAYAE